MREYKINSSDTPVADRNSLLKYLVGYVRSPVM